ncbi:MAG: hypothetical protein ACLP05_14390 [Candidatus Kryptoniota bacterium]
MTKANAGQDEFYDELIESIFPFGILTALANFSHPYRAGNCVRKG